MDVEERITGAVSITLEPLLTRADLQGVLRLSTRTIGRLVAEGGLPAPIRVGQRQRWRRCDIERFLAQQAHGDGFGLAQGR